MPPATHVQSPPSLPTPFSLLRTHAPVEAGHALSPAQAADLILLPGAVDAVAALAAAGAKVFVVTNQPDVARGRLDPAELALMHDHLRATLAVDDIAVCPHDGAEGCHCRKPRPGMLIDLAARHRVDLDASYMVGDRWVDIAAGAAAGCTTILVERRYSWDSTSAGSPPATLHPDHRVANVATAAGVILARARRTDARTRAEGEVT